MRRFGSLVASVFAVSALTLSTPATPAEMGMGVRGGTMGFGLDFDVGLTEKLNLRLGYNFFDYDDTLEDTDVSYDSTIKISSFSALLDWHVAGGFRLSAGAVGSGPKLEVVGTPSGNNTYEIGNGTYTAAQVGSLQGEVKIGNSVAPYIGLGWGNVISEKHRVTFLFDLGAVYGGEPDVSLTARCGTGISPTICNQLQTDVQRETQELKDDVSTVEWYPVIQLGIGIRF
jgi:hypothetical protein